VVMASIVGLGVFYTTIRHRKEHFTLKMLIKT